jgi:hypothetical protein
MTALTPLAQPSFRAEQTDFSLPGSLLRTGRPAQREIFLGFCRCRVRLLRRTVGVSRPLMKVPV